jgi:hypothetical protein
MSRTELAWNKISYPGGDKCASRIELLVLTHIFPGPPNVRMTKA